MTTCDTTEILPAPLEPRDGWPWCAPSDEPAGFDSSIAWPKITLVTPSYNQAAYIEETIRSVLLQRYPNLEYIIIDGGSNDGSVEIIRRYATHLHDWVSEPDRGQSHAINKGMARGTGEICGWLCSDDLLMPGALRTIRRAFADSPDIRWLAGKGEFLDVTQDELRERKPGIESPTALMEFWSYGGRGAYLPQPSTFWHRDLWDAVGGLREDNHLTMDYELWLAFEEREPLAKLHDVLSRSRLHEDCKTMHHRREQVRDMMRCAYAAADRRGYGRVRLTLNMLRWIAGRHWRRGTDHLRARCLRSALRAYADASRQTWRIWKEDGRLGALNL